MILTYKIKHNCNFSAELMKARQVAEYALTNGFVSTKFVKQFGLKSVVACQILKKYGNNKTIKKISRVNLIVPGQGANVAADKKSFYISCLKLTLDISRLPEFFKINQVELNKEYAFVSVTVKEQPQIKPISWIGVDLNTTGHCAVASCSDTGKVLKLGKSAYHVHNKYKQTRKLLQKKLKYKVVKKISNRESRIVRDINHKVSKSIVNFAKENNAGIVLEDLTGIRKTKKQVKSFKYSLHSWSFFQLRQFVEYKAKLLGIPVAKINPAFTSQQCSRCGILGKRVGKHFECSYCGHVEDADVNASFVIGLRHQGNLRLPEDRVSGKGNTDIPQEATAQRMQTLKPSRIKIQRACQRSAAL